MGGTEFNEQGGGVLEFHQHSQQRFRVAVYSRIGWNDTALAGSLAATGGGASVYFPQPAWQTGYRGCRTMVCGTCDIALNASVYHVSYYVISEGSGFYVGGTSAATPTMAGVVALLNHSLNQQGVGNINPTLYQLARTAPQVFHDVTSGNNIVPCAWGGAGLQQRTAGL